MENGQIIVALIGFAGVILSVFMTAKTTRDQVTQSLSTHQAVTDEKIKTLSDEVKKHNELIDRVYKLEADSAVQDAELKRHSKRLENLENHHAASA